MEHPWTSCQGLPCLITVVETTLFASNDAPAGPVLRPGGCQPGPHQSPMRMVKLIHFSTKHVVFAVWVCQMSYPAHEDLGSFIHLCPPWSVKSQEHCFKWIYVPGRLSGKLNSCFLDTMSNKHHQVISSLSSVPLPHFFAAASPVRCSKHTELNTSITSSLRHPRLENMLRWPGLARWLHLSKLTFSLSLR